MHMHLHMNLHYKYKKPDDRKAVGLRSNQMKIRDLFLDIVNGTTDTDEVWILL